MYKFYLEEKDYFDATIFYTSIISDAILTTGGKTEYVDSLSKIEDGDIVFVINIWAAQKVWSTKKEIKVIVWFQGIAPEESVLSSISFIDNIKSTIKLRYFEYITLRKSRFNLFVSEKMVEHYKRIYNYNKNNYYIMPCFNQELDQPSFFDSKYNTPSFVYTGNLAAWQCFEPMVKLFSEIKNNLPSATLTIYTKEQEKAKNILSKYGIQAEIKYVPFQILSQEIRQYKYGFIIREDIEINRVATPTKMNSYLASGIIPVYTNVVGAFKEKLSNLHYAVPLDKKGNGLEKLYELEKIPIKAEDVLYEYNHVFCDYYNRTKYVNEISSLFAQM